MEMNGLVALGDENIDYVVSFSSNKEGWEVVVAVPLLHSRRENVLHFHCLSGGEYGYR